MEVEAGGGGSPGDGEGGRGPERGGGVPLVRRIPAACMPAVANAPGHRYSSAATTLCP